MACYTKTCECMLLNHAYSMLHNMRAICADNHACTWLYKDKSRDRLASSAGGKSLCIKAQHCYSYGGALVVRSIEIASGTSPSAQASIFMATGASWKNIDLLVSSRSTCVALAPLHTQQADAHLWMEGGLCIGM